MSSKAEILDRATELKALAEKGFKSNYERRVTYSNIELLIIKIDDYTTENGTETDITELKEELSALSSTINLAYVKRGNSGLLKVIDKLDSLMRLLTVWFFLITSAAFIALPCILFSPVDSLLVKHGIIKPYHQVGVQSKMFIARKILQLSGIHLLVEGLNRDMLGKEMAMVCFSHASTMDAFISAATLPVIGYTLAKSELFLIPFFSWCLMAFGGIPIDRKNRDQAIKAISSAARSAGTGDCVSISPEGTRSVTGQLTAFKKGPFYLWEQVNCPIIPMVTYGAFDLFPPSRIMNIPGKVYVRYLPPIYPHEAQTREQMSRLLRMRMLEAMRDGPEDAGSPLTWWYRLKNMFYMSLVFAYCWGLYFHAPYHVIRTAYNVNSWQLAGIVLLVAIVITLLFYVYQMYIKTLIASVTSTSASDKTTTRSGSQQKQANNSSKRKNE